MSLPIITKDFTKNSIHIEKLFQSPRSKVWKAYTTDSLLVKWWGPKTWPASSQSFDFRPGGHWHYYMTGPDGTRAWGWIDYISIHPEESFTAEDTFSDAVGNRDTSLPTTFWKTDFFDMGNTTKVVITLSFLSKEHMQTLTDMGFEEGFTDALDNLDTLLATL